MYKVIADFADMQDGGHVYHAGDTFPRDGHEVNPSRLSVLLSNSNRLNQPLIAEAVNNTVKSEKAAKTAENAPEKEPEARRTRRKKS